MITSEQAQIIGRYGWRWSNPGEDGVRDVLVVDRLMDRILKVVSTPRDANEVIDRIEEQD